MMNKDSVGNRIKILSYKRISLGPINVKPSLCSDL